MASAVNTDGQFDREKTSASWEEQTPTVTCVQNLDSDVLTMIFEYLDIPTLKASALVCKLWKELIYLPKFWRTITPTISLEYFNIVVAESIQERGIESICFYMTEKSCFDMNLCEYLNKAKVNSLTIRNLFLEGFSSRPLLEGQLKHIQKLVVHQSREDSPDRVSLQEGLLILLKSFLNLRRLHLLINTNTHWDPHGIIGKRQHENINIEIATETVSNSTLNLIDLDIKPIPLRMIDSTDSAMRSLSNLKQLKELKRISLGDVRERIEFQFTYWSNRPWSCSGPPLEQLPEFFPELKHLEIYYDQCVLGFPTDTGCKKLESLSIAAHPLQPNTTMMKTLPLFISHCPLLKALDLRGTRLSLAELTLTAQSCPQLELLDISFIRFFGKFHSVLDVIADKLTKLKILLIVGCNFTAGGGVDPRVHISSNFLPKLVHLESIQGIEYSDMDIDDFAEVPLKYISLGRSRTRLRGNEHAVTIVDHQSYARNVRGSWSLVEDLDDMVWEKAWGFNYFKL